MTEEEPLDMEDVFKDGPFKVYEKGSETWCLSLVLESISSGKVYQMRCDEWAGFYLVKPEDVKDIKW